ncbi:hypothetical protein [Maridesulfovibrio sp.]|uniref:4-hydroxy-2-oxovalerate aldolase n=1 Tax=Maridesulfovibrio sp. TaxID=2795000 RepID=UPI003BAA7FFB
MAQTTLLECTLRDGSYAVNFQFTPQESILMALALERAGARMIEVGHGLGLNATNCGKGEAAASDEEYMEVMSGRLNKALWGMFCIPTIAEKEHLQTAARYNMGFVRIGTNVTEHEQAAPFIELARSEKIFVAANLMKSYAVSKEELAKKAQDMERYGAQALYLVDSAGTMLPNDVAEYVTSLRKAIDIPIGFHGHDNLSLALANSLAAIDAGAQYIDTTLQGLGRGGGNPATELLVAALQKRGEITDEFNLNLLLDISQEMITPLQREPRLSPLSVISGYAGFHSSFLGAVLAVAKEFDVDARDLIVRLCEEDRIRAPKETLVRLAKDLAAESADSDQGIATSIGEWIHGSPYTKRYGIQPLERLLNDIKAVAKSPERGVLNVVCAQQHQEEPFVSPLVQDQESYAIGSVEVGSLESAIQVFQIANGKVPSLLVDDDVIDFIPKPLSEVALQYAPDNQIYSYSDSSTWASSVVEMVIEKFGPVRDKKFILHGHGNVLQHAGWALSQFGSILYFIDPHEKEKASLWNICHKNDNHPQAPSPADQDTPVSALVSFARDTLQLKKEHILHWKPELVIDAGIGGISPAAIAEATMRNIPIIRPDMRASITAKLHALQGARNLIRTDMGRKQIEDIHIVGGGYLGQAGDIVVDSIGNPTRVIGIATGDGFVDYELSDEHKKKIERIWKHIINNRYFLKRNS